MSAMLRVFKNKWITPPKAVDQDFSGRIIIVTGATSGVGKEAAFKFAALGAAKVIITARDLQKGERVKAELTSRLCRDGQLEVWQLDMMDYGSVAAFAKRAEQLNHIDIVVLNAGTRRRRFIQSQYGWEEDLQVNALSTTLLAILLLPKLRASRQQTGRTPILELVNSGLHQNAIVPSPVQQEANILQHYNRPENFKEGSQYKFSKTFLMYATNKLADEVTSGDVIVTSVCPGWVYTDLGRDRFFPGIHVLAFFFIVLFMRTPSQGANTVLSVTTHGERVHGRFYQHDVVQPVPPSVAGPEKKALGSRIWDEMVEALEKDVSGFAIALEAALPSKRRENH
ncbi:hypothetical protein J1614_004738 [Plenodomus biglobosus]|nr:hypothetical protein J1614_004738 [Plenodomus biglobosus]